MPENKPDKLLGEKARQFVRARRYGMLATISKKLEGYPFGSVVPYMLDEWARPIILISTLAEHTKNIAHDSRVSLLVLERGGDVQAEARATLVGDCSRIDDQESPKERYLRYFPAATDYFETHDFFFYRIEPKIIRYIGGFGDIHWIGAESYFPLRSTLSESEQAIIVHMNEDHAHNLRDYCLFYQDRKALEVFMLGIDCDGFDVRADGEILRFEFGEPVLDANQAREALIAMARADKS